MPTQLQSSRTKRPSAKSPDHKPPTTDSLQEEESTSPKASPSGGFQRLVVAAGIVLTLAVAMILPRLLAPDSTIDSATPPSVEIEASSEPYCVEQAWAVYRSSHGETARPTLPLCATPFATPAAPPLSSLDHPSITHIHAAIVVDSDSTSQKALMRLLASLERTVAPPNTTIDLSFAINGDHDGESTKFEWLLERFSWPHGNVSRHRHPHRLTPAALWTNAWVPSPSSLASNALGVLLDARAAVSPALFRHVAALQPWLAPPAAAVLGSVALQHIEDAIGNGSSVLAAIANLTGHRHPMPALLSAAPPSFALAAPARQWRAFAQWLTSHSHPATEATHVTHSDGKRGGPATTPWPRLQHPSVSSVPWAHAILHPDPHAGDAPWWLWFAKYCEEAHLLHAYFSVDASSFATISFEDGVPSEPSLWVANLAAMSASAELVEACSDPSCAITIPWEDVPAVDWSGKLLLSCNTIACPLSSNASQRWECRQRINGADCVLIECCNTSTLDETPRDVLQDDRDPTAAGGGAGTGNFSRIPPCIQGSPLLLDALHATTVRMQDDSADLLEDTAIEFFSASVLAEVLPRVAVDNTVIMVTCNVGFLDFIENWLISVRRLGITNYIAIAEDIDAYKALRPRYGERVMLTPSAAVTSSNTTLNISGRAFQYASKEYNLLVGRRPQYIRAVLELDYHVLYSVADIDVVWLESPLPYVHGRYDLWIQSDLDHPASNPWAMLCTGFVFLKSNPRTVALMHAWHAALVRVVPGRDVNQYLFNEVLKEQFLSSLRVRVLSPVKFPSGALFFEDQWRLEQREQPCVIHNNYIIGRERKLLRFKKMGLWYLPDP